MQQRMPRETGDLRTSKATPLDMVRWIWSVDSPLETSDKAVMTALVMNRNNGTGHCCPSQGRLARQTGLHRSTVNNALKRCEEPGILRRTRRKFSSTLYELFPNGIPVQPGKSDSTGMGAGFDQSPVSATVTASANDQWADADKLMKVVLDLGCKGAEPADYARHAARARELLKLKPLAAWLEMAGAMDQLFPYSRGDTWDIFILGSKGHLALGKARSQDNSGDQYTPVWERRMEMLQS